MVTFLALLATVVGSMTAISPLLQARRIHEVRSSRDVSLASLTFFWFSYMAWELYGIALGSAALIVTNIFGLVCMGFTIVTTIRYRRSALTAEAEVYPEAALPA